MINERFLKACRRQPVDATPIWLMRQAGRYMPEYRAVRAKHTMLEAINTPELACEITLQPVDAFDLDAAIIFADILTPLIGMGLKLDFVEGEGPRIENLISKASDVAALRTPPAAENTPGTLEAVRLTRRQLGDRIPLIGFAGAPFTLASYAIEGGGSKHYVRAKSFMYAEPQAWAQLMEKLVTVITGYLQAQAEAGAQTLQVFDSWAGVLSPPDYEAYVLPYNIRIFEALRTQDVPLIYFGTDMNGLLPLVRRIPADVFGVDWRAPLGWAWEQFGPSAAVQGNLDPVTLFAPWEKLAQQAETVLNEARNRPGHIFNLGHGILPGTPVENVRRLVDHVHEVSARR